MSIEYSVVVPVLDEREALEELARWLTPVLNALDEPAEVVLIDDGSTDGSFELMRQMHQAGPRFRALRLSRNFGHQIAITAGLEHALGRMSEVDIPRDAGDFRLIDRQVVDAVKGMPEHRRYLRGLFAWVGYDQVGVHYVREARQAGRTVEERRYPLFLPVDTPWAQRVDQMLAWLPLGGQHHVVGRVTGVQ